MFESPTPILRSALLARLGECLSAPLDPPVRQFMEGKFGADFSDVKVHTGPAAGRLCRALEARAFTLGSDIVFGDGEYAPASSAGRHLIAHELAHILQQRAGECGRRSALVPIGDPEDDCESEADRLAAEALAGGVRRAATPDRSGAIRRAVQIMPNSAKMTTNRAGSTPGAEFTTRSNGLTLMILHLTRHKNAILTHNILSDAAASAITINGSLQVMIAPSDNIGSWEFRFIQLLYEPTHQALYAGMTPAEGSVAIDYVDSNADFLLDRNATMWPYTNQLPPAIHSAAPSVPAQVGWLRIEARTDDHPNGFFPAVWQNYATNKDNYLVRVKKSIHLYTALVAKDPASTTYQCLAHVVWTADWNVDIRWTKSGNYHTSCTGDMVAVPHEYQGEPTVASRAALITNPPTSTSSMYNSSLEQKVSVVFGATADNQYIKASRQWPADMPPNFQT